MRSFVKIKSSQIGYITLSFIDIGESRPCCKVSRKLNPAKISEFTVPKSQLTHVLKTSVKRCVLFEHLLFLSRYTVKGLCFR